MLAPVVLISLHVVIEKSASRLVQREILHDHRREHHRSAAACRHAVDLRELTSRKLYVPVVLLYRRGEKHVRAVRERLRILVGRMCCEPRRGSSVTAHDEDVEPAVAV